MASTSTSLTLPVLPLDDEVVLPGMVVPLDLSDTDVRAAVEAAQAAATSGNKPRVLLVPRVDGTYAGIGTLGRIEQVGRLSDGDPGALIRGLGRVRIGSGTTGPGAALWVEGTTVEETVPDPLPGAVAELVTEYKALATSWLRKRGAWQVVDRVQQIEDVPTLADNSGYSPFLTTEQKVQLLETVDPVARLKAATEALREHLAEQDVAESIAKDVQEGVDKQQREFLLRRQLEAVRKELAGLNGDPEDEGDDYRARVEAADLPEDVRKAALKEVDKLERSSDQNPEGSWIRTWLDTVLELPWNERTEDAYDIAGAKEILDADHSGLEDVKERITEYLAVRKRRAERGLGLVGGRRGGAVLALVGPPGVGKTSLGESVARAMGRKFVRVALGGVRDEAEIRGHRRTYVGALPGRIVRAIKEAGSMNPVVLLDEIDKVGSDFRGDPAAALLEVLDPAQNHTFRDHYLEVELDLSDVVFLATANVLEAIPEPLLDRMELVRLDGYTEDEKVVIARDHLLPRQLERAGLEPGEVTLEDDALRKLAGEYTREAGVRNLERAVARLLRKVAAQHELGRAGAAVHGRRGAAAPADRAAAPHPRVGAGPGRAAHRGARCGHRPRGHRRRRRRALRGGVARRSGDRGVRAPADRPARRRDEGVRTHRAVVPALARRGTGASGRRPEGARSASARTGGRRPQGRAERGRDDDDGAGLAAVGPAGPAGRGDDRRGLADRAGAADRRRQAEAAGGAPGRDHHRDHPPAQ